MPKPFPVATRIVREREQEQFAALCGDRNPMHMDPVAARRTQAGQPVVHGIHTLLWALDTLAAKGLLQSPPARVRVRFLKWIYLGDTAALSLPSALSQDPTMFEVSVLGLPVLSAELTYGDRSSAAPQLASASPRAPIPQALDLSMDELEGVEGTAFTAQGEHAAALFPAIAELLGGTAVAEIAACSYIVGMEAPGLHSMFSKADLSLAEHTQQPDPRAALHYDVAYTDARFRKARIAVTGAQVHGTLEVFLRVPPVQQPSMALVAQHVRPDEFRGMRALIIGGSRGLGELTAKLIAAGGGVPTITYAIGRADAERVHAEITAAGGEAQVFPYDVQHPPQTQLQSLTLPPTHLFYFATRTIYRPRQGVFSISVLDDFAQVYLTGFYDLCLALTERAALSPSPAGKLIVLYPSTVFIAERPPGMTEYAMIKAAGELLCADMNQNLPGLHIVAHRFPKLPTDQTAGIIPERETDALDALLPVLRQLHRLAP